MAETREKLGWKDAWDLFEDVLIGLVVFLGIYFLLVVVTPEILYFMKGLEHCPSDDGWFSVYTWKSIATFADGVLVAAFLWKNFSYTLCKYVAIPKLCQNGEH